VPHSSLWCPLVGHSIARACGRSVPSGGHPLKSKIRRACGRSVQSSIGAPRSACDRVPHSSRSHALAVVRFPAGGTKGTSGALDRTRLRLKWVRPKALRNWNATHSGSDCNVTCNVEHIFYNQNYLLI